MPYKDPPKERKWRPGQSGNPAGSSKKQRMVKEILASAEGSEVARAMAIVALKAALSGDPDFWKAVCDRVDGKPRKAARATREAPAGGAPTLRESLDIRPDENY